MKLFILSFLFFMSLTCIGQTEKTTNINLIIGDCRNDEIHHWMAEMIIFYKLPENSVAIKITPRKYKQLPIKLNNIPIADYKVEFKNNFNQTVSKIITLADKETNSILLCQDSLLNYSQNTLTRLHDKDSIAINFRSQGCYHMKESKILIRKQGSSLHAELYKVNWSIVTKGEKNMRQNLGDSLIKAITLTQQNINDFFRFENELNFVTDGGCTTTDWYEINCKFLNKKVTDGGCDWDGYDYLRKSLFGDKK